MRRMKYPILPLILFLGILLLDSGAQERLSAPGRTGRIWSVDSLLSTYHAEALQNHPDLASMQAMIEAENSRLSMASSWMNPELMLGIMSLPTSLDFHEEAMTAKEIGFMIRVPFPGKLKAASQGQKDKVAFTQSNYEQMRLDMSAMVSMAYYDLAGNLAVGRALAEGQSLAKDAITAARIMVASGMGSQADLLRAQLEADQWSRRIIENDQKISTSRSRLGAALGRSSSDFTLNPNPLSPPGELVSLDQVLIGALDHTPSRQAQQRKVDQAAADLRRARLDYWPDVDVTFKYGFRDYLKAGAMGGSDMTTPLDNMLSLELSFPVPLFYRGNQQALIQENQAMLHQAEAEYRSGDVKLRDEIRQSYARWISALRMYDLISDTLLPGAEAAFQAALPDYQRGTLPFMALSEALMQVVMQKMDRDMALADVYMAKAELERLMGRKIA